jgi:hypothetical protein
MDAATKEAMVAHPGVDPAYRAYYEDHVSAPPPTVPPAGAGPLPQLTSGTQRAAQPGPSGRPSQIPPGGPASTHQPPAAR